MSNVVQFPSKGNEKPTITRTEYDALKKALDDGKAQFFELSPHEKFELFETAAKFSLTAMEIAIDRGMVIERLEKLIKDIRDNR